MEIRIADEIEGTREKGTKGSGLRLVRRGEERRGENTDVRGDERERKRERERERERGSERTKG